MPGRISSSCARRCCWHTTGRRRALDKRELVEDRMLPESDSRDLPEPMDIRESGRLFWKAPESMAASSSPRAFSRTRSPVFC